MRRPLCQGFFSSVRDVSQPGPLESPSVGETCLGLGRGREVFACCAEAVLARAPCWLLLALMVFAVVTRPGRSAEPAGLEPIRYAEALASGAAVFSFEKSGLEAGAQFFGAEADAAFARDYDAVRILGLAQKNLGRRGTPAEIAALFRGVRKKEAELLQAFFRGAMVNYIVAASKGLNADASVLVALAARIDPELQRMMAYLAGAQAKLSTWTKPEVEGALRQLAEMNEQVVIPKGYFLKIATRSTGKNAHFYFICYQVTGKEPATVEGRPVEILFVTELNMMNVVSGTAGFRVHGSRQVVIEDGALRKRAKELKGRGVRGAEKEILASLRYGLIVHELAHDVRVAYSGEGSLFEGLPVRVRIDSKARAQVSSETFSMLAALFRGDVELEMYLLQEHVNQRPVNSVYSIGAKWIFRQLVKHQPSGMLQKDPLPLERYSPAELLEATAKTIEQGWGKAGLAAVKELEFPSAVKLGKRD